MKFNFKQHPNKDQKRYNKLVEVLMLGKPTDEHSFSKMLKSILNKLKKVILKYYLMNSIENLKEVKTPELI